MPDLYVCPLGCETNIKSLRGWKQHMTGAHGGYTPEQLNQAVGPTDNEAIHVTGEDDFDSYANKMPETAQGFTAAPPSPASSPMGGGDAEPGVEGAPPEPAPVRRTVSKKLKKQIEKMQGMLTTVVPRQWFNAQADKYGDHWRLNADEESMISESLETVFEVLGIEFEFEPLNITLTHWIWVLMYPVAVLLFVVTGKQAKHTGDGSAGGATVIDAEDAH